LHRSEDRGHFQYREFAALKEVVAAKVAEALMGTEKKEGDTDGDAGRA